MSDVYLLVIGGRSAIYLLEDYLLMFQRKKQALLYGEPGPITICACDLRAFHMLLSYSIQDFVVRKNLAYKALMSDVDDLYEVLNQQRLECLEISVRQLLHIERMTRWLYQDISIHLGDSANKDCLISDDTLLEELERDLRRVR